MRCRFKVKSNQYGMTRKNSGYMKTSVFTGSMRWRNGNKPAVVVLHLASETKAQFIQVISIQQHSAEGRETTWRQNLHICLGRRFVITHIIVRSVLTTLIDGGVFVYSMARDRRLQVAGQRLGNIQGYTKGNEDKQRFCESENCREIARSQGRQHAKVRLHTQGVVIID